MNRTAPVYDVPAMGVTVVLGAIQQINRPEQYGPLLRRAGLGRFVDALPAPPLVSPFQMVASSGEMRQLYVAIFDMLGEGLTRLCFSNLGTAIAAGLWDQEPGASIIRQVKAAPADAQIGLLAGHLSRLTTQYWAPLVIDMSHTPYTQQITDCPVCRDLRNRAQAPICTSGVQVWKESVKRLGRRVQIREVECVATGGSCCRYEWSEL